MLKTSYGSNPVSGIDLATSGEMAERQIQIKLLEIFNFHTITSAIHQIKAERVVNPATMSDFKKAERASGHAPQTKEYTWLYTQNG